MDVKLINLIPRSCTYFKDRKGREEVDMLKDSSRLEYYAHVAKKFHKPLILKQSQMGIDMLNAGSVDIRVLKFRTISGSDEFKRSCEFITLINNRKVSLIGLKAFVRDCEGMSNHELKQLLHLFLKMFTEKKWLPGGEEWPPGVKTWPPLARRFFHLLEKEMCKRLNSCIQETSQAKEVLNYFEEILHVMLYHGLGYNCFLTYIRYLQYCSISSISMENISLLLLSMIRVCYTSQMIFAYLEDFMLRNFDGMDLKTLSLFCTAAVICSCSIHSHKLLDLLAIQLLQSYQDPFTKGYTYRYMQQCILKGLRTSGFFKLSFYHNLETCLQNQNTINKCNAINEMVHILNAFRRLRILPKTLLESSVERCKHLINQNTHKHCPIDLSFFVLILGYFQYKDTTDNDIYTLCANKIIQLQKSEAYGVLPIASFLTSCVTGLVFAGKFHAGAVDALFSIPNIGTLLQDSRKSELLMIDDTLKIQHPEYTGNKLEKKDRENLQRLVDEQWSLEEEMEQTRDFELNINILKELVGEDNIKIGYIIPHFKSVDVMLYVDEHNRVVPPDLAKKSVAVGVIGYNQCVNGADMLLGRFALKQRQLALMGYKIVVAYPYERQQVMRYGSSAEKLKFWRNKLEACGIVLDSRNYS